MTDPIPHNRNRLGVVLGVVFHPMTIFVPALFVVMKGIDLRTAVAWIAFVAAMTVIPLAALLYRVHQRNQRAYHRHARHSMYIGFWLCMVASTLIAVLGDAPRRLLFTLAVLLIWVPIQFTVNILYTKISAHTAVIAGIMTSFAVMGELDHILLVVGAGLAVIATAWARMSTGNHSLKQVTLGVVVSTTSVLLTTLILPPT